KTTRWPAAAAQCTASATDKPSPGPPRTTIRRIGRVISLCSFAVRAYRRLLPPGDTFEDALVQFMDQRRRRDIRNEAEASLVSCLDQVKPVLNQLLGHLLRLVRVSVGLEHVIGPAKR